MENSIRISKFRSLRIDPWYSKYYPKLRPNDLSMIEKFIIENDSLDRPSFELKLNRFFIDSDKPKNWKLILEFLMISNMK